MKIKIYFCQTILCFGTCQLNLIIPINYCQIILIDQLLLPSINTLSMTHPILHPHEFKPQFLIITFRKLLSKTSDLNNTKIIPLVKVNTSQPHDQIISEYQRGCYQISQSRTIKNGMACFYGESITISQRVRNFTVQILVDSSSLSKISPGKVLLNVQFGTEKLVQLEKRKDVFSISSQFVQLVCQAQITYNNQEKREQKQQMSLDDIPDTNHGQQEGFQQLVQRKVYSPAVRGQFRKKRQSFRFTKDNRKSQLFSESPHKMTMDTNQTQIRIKKRIKLASPPNIKNELCGLKQLRRESNANKQKNDRDLIKALFLDHPILKKEKNKKSKSKTKKNNFRYQQPLTPKQKTQKKPAYNPKKTERILDKLTLKSIVYTSLVGIIGGMAAAHF